jgi:phage shock protein PspC (stress-responsive transcriptional regulator)
VRGRRLDRRVDDRVVAGVAGGLGDAFGVDPAIFRLTFVTLTFFGGGGLVLYALGWLFMPARDTRDSIGESMLRRAGGPRSAGGVALMVIAALIVVGSLSDIGGGLVWGVVMVIVGALVFRSDSLGGPPAPSTPGTRSPAGATTAGDRTTAPVTPPPARPTTSTDAPPPVGDAPLSVDNAPTTDLHTAAAPVADAWSVGGPTIDQRYSTADVDPSSPPDLPPPIVDDGWRPRPLAPRPAPPPPPSILGRVTVAATLIAVGALALLDNLTALDVAIASYAAVSLVIIGGGLLVGAVVGRARGLIPLGAVALVIVWVSAFVPELPVMPSGGTGERIHAPRTAAELEPSYEFGIGELVVDLGDLELAPGQDTEVDVTLGMGEMIIEVPPDVAVDVDATMRIGAIEALGRTSDGPAASTTFTEPGGEGAPTIDLDLVNGIGKITVRRAPEAN